MRLSKSFFSLVITVLFLIILLLMTICLGINRDAVFIYQVPNSGIMKMHQNDDDSFSFLSDSLGCFSLYSFDEKNLVTQDIQSGTLVFEEPRGMRRYKSKYMMVSFCADDLEMAVSMGHFTDNLATHDCLFHVFLRPIWLLGIKKARNCKDIFRISMYNISTRRAVSVGNRVHNLKRITYENLTRFEFLYYNKELGLCTLFEKLPENEASWNLYYYPTLYFNEPDWEILKLVEVFNDEKGTLFQFNVPYRPPYIHYYRIDNSRYCRIASLQRDLSLMEDRLIDKEDYLLMAKSANRLIRSFYTKTDLYSGE